MAPTPGRAEVRERGAITRDGTGGQVADQVVTSFREGANVGIPSFFPRVSAPTTTPLNPTRGGWKRGAVFIQPPVENFLVNPRSVRINDKGEVF